MTAPVTGVVEVDIKTGKYICKELLIGVVGFRQTDAGSSDWVGRQGCQEGGRVRVVLYSNACAMCIFIFRPKC